MDSNSSVSSPAGSTIVTSLTRGDSPRSLSGTEMDTYLNKQTQYTYEKFRASKKGAYVVIRTQEVNEDGDRVTVTGAWQPLTSSRGKFLGYQYLGVDSDEEDDRYFITPTKLSSSCKVLEFTMTVFHELDDLCEGPDDRQADEENCSKLSYVHNVGQYFGKLK